MFLSIPVANPAKDVPLILPTVAVFPVLVTSPVKLALVVTVAAFPVIDPAIALVTVKLVKVPTLVKLEPTIVDFKEVPVSVVASAVTVISALPSNATPLIFLVAANLVAVPALPVMVVWSPVFVPLTVASPETVNVFEVVPPAIVNPVV